MSKKECPECLGNGSFGFGATCQMCKGKGYLEKETQKDPTLKGSKHCNSCGGKGELGYGATCPDCKDIN